MQDNIPLVQLNKVSKIYNQGALTVGLHKVSLNFEQGEFVAITGSSGSGKSTLLNVLSCLDSFDEGDYVFNGENINYFSESDRAEFRNKYVSFIFQDYYLIDSYTVYQNIELALLNTEGDKQKKDAKIKELIKAVGLEGFEKHRCSKLSGGQKQRVSIARALAKDSPILFADEPTGNLDKQTTDEILKLLRSLTKGKLVFIVTHSFEELEPYATRKIRLADGEVSEDEVISRVEEKEEYTEKPSISKKQKYFNLFKVGLMNIGSTPKKSLFTLSSLALLTLVFIWVFLLIIGQSTPSLQKSKGIVDNAHYYKYDIEIAKKSVDTTGKSFEEIDSIYTMTNQDLEAISQIDGVKVVYPANNMLNQFVSVEIDDKTFSGYLRNASSVYTYLYKGRLPEAENEIVITLPASRKYTAKNWIGKVVQVINFEQSGFFRTYRDPMEYTLTVCGVIVHDVDDYIVVSDSLIDKMISDRPPENTYVYGAIATIKENANVKQILLSLNEKGYNALYKYGVTTSIGFSSLFVLLTIIGLVGITAIMFRITNGSIKDIEVTKSRDYNIFRTTGLDDWFIKKVYYVEMILTAVIGWLAGTVLAYVVLIIYGFCITPEITYGFSLLHGYAGNISWINFIALAVNLLVTIGNASRFNRYMYKKTIKGVINNA